MRVLAILCLTAGVAHAGSNEIDVGSANRALRSSSADAVTADGLGTGHVGYMRRISPPFDVSDLELWVGGSMEIGGATGTMFQTLSTEIGSYAVLATARARYRLIDHVTATARVALGPARTSLELKDPSGMALSDSGWGVATTGALGLDLTALEDRAMSLGLRFEVGYARTSAPALSPHASVDDSTLHLPMSAASFGHLDLSGPFATFSLITQF